MRRFLFVLVLAVGVLAMLAAPAFASPKTFYVHPSGGNDTAHIQAAFNAAVKAGPGSTVQLSAGHFYTNTIVVRNFRGCFKGAGEGRTVIDTVAGVPVSIVTSVEPFPFLFGFSGGNVGVSAMTCDVTAAAPAAPWYDYWNDITGADYLNEIFLVTGSASSAFDQVGFITHPGDGYDFNVACDIGITGAQRADLSALAPTGGVDTVSRCSLSALDGMDVVGLTAGRLTIGGSAAQRNVFNDETFGCFFADNSGSSIVVSHNRMQAATGESIWFIQGVAAYYSGEGAPLLPPSAPHYLISDNDMLATGEAGGMYLEDDAGYYGVRSRLDALITGNNIDLENTGIDAGIDGFYAKNIRVVFNRMWGTGLAGITLNAVAYFDFNSLAPTSDWQIVGNDLSHLTAVPTPLSPGSAELTPGAKIWLGPEVSHCLVIGGPPPTTVVDQGSDNTFINVTLMPYGAAALSMKAGVGRKVGISMNAGLGTKAGLARLR